MTQWTTELAHPCQEQDRVQSASGRSEGSAARRRVVRVTRKVGAALLPSLAVLALGCSDDDDDSLVPRTGGVPPVTSTVAQHDADSALRWSELAYARVREDRISPPVAARIYGYLGFTMYQALVGGMPGYRSLEGQVNELEPGELPAPDPDLRYHWPAVADAAAAGVLRAMLTSDESRAAIDALAADQREAHDAAAGDAVGERSRAFGDSVAQAVVEWQRSDGFAEHAGCTASEIPSPGEGYWIPEPPLERDAVGLEPCWGQLRMFVGEPVEVPSPTLPPYSTDPSSRMYREALEVYEVVSSGDPEHEEIAAFWGDDPGMTGTPAGHSLMICRQTLSRQDHDLAVAAEAMAKVGMAVHDAFVSCWRTKYTHWWPRPYAYINAFIDPEGDWQPYLSPSPNFPEYTSGHSTESAAAAQVMTDMWGDMSFTDYTHDELGLPPRSFDSFLDAAEEASVSRKYGGIHYDYSTNDGFEQGRAVGRQISALEWRTPSDTLARSQ